MLDVEKNSECGTQVRDEEAADGSLKSCEKLGEEKGCLNGPNSKGQFMRGLDCLVLTANYGVP